MEPMTPFVPDVSKRLQQFEMRPNSRELRVNILATQISWKDSGDWFFKTQVRYEHRSI